MPWTIHPLLKLSKDLIRDKRGQVAILFAMGSVPILLAASIALDMSNASNIKSKLQAAADAAVLAAATRLAINASEADKEELAISTFNANIPPVLAARIVGSPEVAINFPDKTVSMSVAVNVAPLVGRFAADELDLGVSAAAAVSKGTPICMMALNPEAQEALSIQGTADIMAEDCAVHVNSNDDDALHQNGNATGTAESFCVRGGHSGSNFTPPPKDKCWYEEDPLAAQFEEDWEYEDIDSLDCDYSNLPQINTGAGVTTYLTPGVYCGGLTIKKGIVQLQQGARYVFRDGPLHVQAQGQLKGSEVAVLFHGDSSTRLITQSGANVITSARKTGRFKGLAFAQHPLSIPDSENLIIGGGQMEITGILYFPKQPLKLTGNGDIGTTVSQFAILADTIAIEGNGQLNIEVGQNYQDDGLPDLPEAHEVVHLIE
jgi:Flp pilus assembly protein TadG